jgi:hypothetical protein
LIDQTPTPQKRKGLQYDDESASINVRWEKLSPMEPLVKASFILFKRMEKKCERNTGKISL